MKYNFSVGFIALIVCLWVNNSEARMDAHIDVRIGNNPPPERIIVIPRYYIPHKNERIYTPDRYHCYMKRTLKYCHTRKGRPLNGIIVNNYDGAIAYETYQNGYQNGETSIYTQDGTLISRSYYKKGVKDGEEIIYYINGNVELISRYKDGALDGRMEQYDINGAMLGRMTYKKGWFREGYCKNEPNGTPMQDRIKNKKFNEIIPCGSMEK